MLPPHRALTIVDPTSLLGREVTEGVARAFPEVQRRLFHTGVERDHLIAEVAGEVTMVPPLLDLDELEGSGAVILTNRPAPAVCERVLAWLRERPSVALLDCSQPGIAQGEAASVVDVIPSLPRTPPWYHLVDPSLAAPARWLRAMLVLEPEVLHVTLLCPVSGFGAEALDELASQGTARLSGRPTRRPLHLPAVLAFDLVPVGGERLAALEAQLGELFPSVQCGLHVIDSGVFHGNLATVVLRCTRDVPLERARTLLRAAPGLRLARKGESLTASGAADDESAVCGEIRARGRWLTAWLLADGLRIAGDAAVGVLSSLNAS